MNEDKHLTPIKAIRAKCPDCCCGSSNEVKLCTVEKCALWPYRFGNNPYRPELSPEEKARRAELVKKARESKGKNPQTVSGV